MYIYIYISCINYDEIKKGGKGKICILCIFLHKIRKIRKNTYLYVKFVLVIKKNYTTSW